MIYIGFWKRCFAFIIDIIILCAAATLAGALARQLFFKDSFYSGRNTFTLCVFGAMILYFALFEASSLQASPGKLIAGIKTAGADGGKLSAGRSLLRSFIKVIITAPFFVYVFLSFSVVLKITSVGLSIGGIILMAFVFPASCLMLICVFSKRKQNLYDFAAGSVVIYKQTFEIADPDDAACVKAFEEFKYKKSSLHPALMLFVVLFLVALLTAPSVAMFFSKPYESTLTANTAEMPKHEWKQHNLDTIGLKITAPGEFELRDNGSYYAHAGSSRIRVYRLDYSGQEEKEKRIDSVLEWARKRAGNITDITESREDVEISGLKGTKIVLKAAAPKPYQDFHAAIAVLDKNENEYYLIAAVSVEEVIGKNINDKILSSAEITER